MHAAVTAGTHAGGRGCLRQHWLMRPKAPPTVRGGERGGQGAEAVAVFSGQAAGPVQTSQAEAWLWGRRQREKTSFTVINKRYGSRGALHNRQHTGKSVGQFDWAVLKSRYNFLLYCQTVEDKNKERWLWIGSVAYKSVYDKIIQK